VDTFIISSEFAKNLMVRAGIPSEKLVVKPNLVISKEQDYISSDPGGYAIFVGRLDERKGIYTLLKAVENTGIPLKLVGEGDLGGYVKDWLKERPGLSIQMLGWLNKESVLEHIRNSNFLILPSEFYESFGNVIVEAFACGVPVLTSRMGAQADLVEDYHTGLLFQPGNADDLASKIRWFQDHPQELMQMRKAARGAYNAKYTTEHIYQQLLNIYQNTLIACCKRAQS
jgi:glycosyltransferase involved in cell wall biosynthesis